MNLFVAVVLDGFSESKRQNEAEINPHQFQEFRERWADYDPKGSGFLNVNDFLFLVNEVHKPMGMLEIGENIYDEEYKRKLEFKKRQYYARKRNFKESKNKRVILTNTDIFKTLGPLKLLFYEDKIHYRDVCVALSQKAVFNKEDQKKFSNESELDEEDLDDQEISQEDLIKKKMRSTIKIVKQRQSQQQNKKYTQEEIKQMKSTNPVFKKLFAK